MSSVVFSSALALSFEDHEFLLENAFELIERESSGPQRVVRLLNLLENYLLCQEYNDEVKLLATKGVRCRVVPLVGNHVNVKFLAVIGELHMNRDTQEKIARLPAEEQEQAWNDHIQLQVESFKSNLKTIRKESRIEDMAQAITSLEV
jgi:hypothetical protein